MKNCRFLFSVFFFKLVPKLSDFINSDDCIGKIILKYMRLKSVFFFKKRFEVNKKQILSSEKIRNSGNCFYDYAHSFFGEHFESNALYWLYL